MLLPSLFLRNTPSLVGERVRLRFPHTGDYHQWAALRGESRRFLEPWEPRWQADELEPASWRRRLRLYRREFVAGTAVSFLIFNNGGEELIGGITLGNIRRGVAQNAQIGYWLGERYAGQGHMLDAVRLVTAYAFDTLKLHRIEAACIPGNMRSVRVLEKAGFQFEGFLRSYLRINDRWQDHCLYALVEHDHGITKRG